MSTNRYNLGLFNSGTYTPFACDVTAVTTGETTTITTSQDHSFVVGNLVQFFIPSQWGMTQLDQRKGLVLAVPSATEIEVEIDSREFSSFTTPASPTQPAQVLSAGDRNYGDLSPGGIPVIPQTVPGSFINVAP